MRQEHPCSRMLIFRAALEVLISAIKQEKEIKCHLRAG
jgi:hypothetical protein